MDTTTMTTQIFNDTYLPNSDIMHPFNSTGWEDVIGYLANSLGVFMNGFTLIIVLIKRSLRKQHNIFTFNLALTDCLGAASYISDAFLKSGHHQMMKDTFRFSSMFSANINFLSVAVYRFITVRVDPFGARGIVTTLRCLVACVIGWCVSFGAGTLFARYTLWGLYGSFFLLCLAVTGLCYVLIYRAVTSNACREAMTKKRLKENWRLLQAFALIYGLTVFCWIWLCIVWLMVHNHRSVPVWLNYLVHTCFTLSRIINPTIYWWRLSEFRALLPRPKCCKRNEIIALHSDV